MKLHFVMPHATLKWPMVGRLRQSFPSASFDCGGLSEIKYKSRLQLLMHLPKLFWFAFRSIKRVHGENMTPEWVVVNSDMEAMGVAFARLLSRQRFSIILLGLIYTNGKSAFVNSLKKLYYRLILSATRGVICYSELEAERYTQLFGLSDTHFVPAHWGGDYIKPDDLQPSNSGYLLSAGRSGRDYKLLCEAVENLPVKLHIICDADKELQGLKASPNVVLLANCHGVEFTRQLAGADLVIIPLKDDENSSGQMVLLHAMSFGKPVIITQTPTTVEYGKHLQTVYFVKPDSVDELRFGIAYLLANKDVCSALGAAAKADYEANHSLRCFIDNVAKAIRQIAASH